MIEYHRVTFLGDKVAHGRWSKLGAFLMNNDVATIGVAVTFAAVATELVMPGGSAALGVAEKALAYGSGMALFIRGLEHYGILGYIFPGGISKNKIINKNPDDAPLSRNDVLFSLCAAEVKNAYVAGLVGSAVTLLPFLSPLAVKAMNDQSMACELIGALVVPTIEAVRLGSGIYRWHKVKKAEWRVEDRGPPPGPVRKPAPSLNSAATSAAARVAHAPT